MLENMPIESEQMLYMILVIVGLIAILVLKKTLTCLVRILLVLASAVLIGLIYFSDNSKEEYDADKNVEYFQNGDNFKQK